MNHGPRRRAGGFTLVELMVVLVIVLLISAVALPAIIPALSNRQVTSAAQILQAGLVAARDAAVRANAPRGIRLLPDPVFNGQGGPLAYNRFIAIEPAPDLSDDSENGSATFPGTDPVTGLETWSWVDPNTGNATNTPPPFPFPRPLDTTMLGMARGNYPFWPAGSGNPRSVLMVTQAVFITNMPTRGFNPPTSWFWNVRIGDRFRFNDAGAYYTVVGPMTIPNPEFFVNDGPGMTGSLRQNYADALGNVSASLPQFLFLVNGFDDDGDGYVDNGVNGVNENANFITGGALSTTAGTPPVPAVDEIVPTSPTMPGEWTEVETYLGNQSVQSTSHVKTFDLVNTSGTPAGPTPVLVSPWVKWTITRRPVPADSAQEVNLPSATVIDATTYDQPNRERSRLPVDTNTGYVDILLNPAGQVVPTTTYSNPGGFSMDQSFYHFWISDRTDVHGLNETGSTAAPKLPIPQASVVYDPSTSTNVVPTYTGVTTYLKKDRQLVTLYSRTGQVLTNSIENFDFLHAFGFRTTASYDAGQPFSEAQFGIREAK